MFLKKYLPLPVAGLVVLALAACSQSSEPEEALDPAAPVVKPEPPRKGTGKQKASGAGAKVSAPAVRPVEVGPFVPSAPGRRIAQVSVPGPYVAVTFDDGPSAAFTPQVLDIFNRHGAHATFFVLGQNANRNRSILSRAVAEGHEVGAHTWSHINMRASSVDKVRSELDRTNAVIEAATGHAPRVMRPPYGSINQSLVNLVYNRYGTPAILWDVDTNDWRKPGVQTVVNRAVNQARPGSIILLHDIHASTLAAVEGIVTGLQARGFKLVTVSELIAIGRRAAGASAPERQAEETLTEEVVAAAPAPDPAAPESVSAEESPLHAQQQQQLPQGAAAIGAAPGAAEGTAPAAPAEPSAESNLSE